MTKDAKPKYAKQGHGDSLCGIYSLVNVICKFEKVTEDHELYFRRYFEHLILAAERLGYLDYHHITVGFEAFELKNMVEFISENFGHNLEAHVVVGGDVQARIAEISENVSVLIYLGDVDHWVAKAKCGVLDSLPENGPEANYDFKNADYGLLVKQNFQD